MVDVRRIRQEERDVALDTVVEAFRDDPQVRWYFPDDDAYEVDARRFFGVLLDVRIEGGEVWVAGETASDCAAVAMWNPPGGNLIGPDVASSRYASALSALTGPSASRVSAVDHAVDPLLPSEAHWYLGVLACRASCRGRGFASAVLAPVLGAADRGRLPVALETGTKENVAYYTRRGFAVSGDASVDGVHVWVMRREPA